MQKTDEVLRVRCHKSLKIKLTAIATEKRRKMSNLVIEVLESYCDNHEATLSDKAVAVWPEKLRLAEIAVDNEKKKKQRKKKKNGHEPNQRFHHK